MALHLEVSAAAKPPCVTRHFLRSFYAKHSRRDPSSLLKCGDDEDDSVPPAACGAGRWDHLTAAPPPRRRHAAAVPSAGGRLCRGVRAQRGGVQRRLPALTGAVIGR